MGVAAAIAGAAVVSAGAQIGSAALANKGGGGGGAQPFGSDPSADSSPALQIAEFNNLLQQGIFDPSSLMRASPVNRVVGEIRSNIGPRDSLGPSARVRQLRQLLEMFESGQPIDASKIRGGMKFTLDRILGAAGFSSLEALFAAEGQFRQQIGPIFESARQAAGGNFRANLDVQNQITNLLANLPDASRGGIESLRAEEKERLLRDLNLNVDEQRGDVLELANSGNFNPGRPLGDLEEFRARATQDADLDALGRALALIGGQQSAAGANLDLLYSRNNILFNQATQLASLDQGVGSASLVPIPGRNPSNNNALASGIAAAGNTFGSGILALGNLSSGGGTSSAPAAT